MPTRYLISADIDLKGTVAEDKLANKESRKQMKREVRKIFTEK
jgi:hypothetical protein